MIGVTMECRSCQREVNGESFLCKKCSFNLKDNLSEIPALQSEAKGFLVPGRTGSGSPTSERSIGFNVSAMDYSVASDILPVLHGYEAKIRRGRNLTPPALLKREPSIDGEVAATIHFHLNHLDWTLKQDWVGDFAGEVKVIHAKGLSVTKKFIEKPRRIPCPTDECKAHVVIDIENILGGVTCIKCKTSWTLYRLIQLAMDNPNRRFWLDIEAICLWLNISKREAKKIINTHHIPKKNGLYDIAAIAKNRNNSIEQD
jgi:hypothetical protein